MSELASESMSQRIREVLTSPGPTERSERGGEAGTDRSTGRLLPSHPASPPREGER